MTSTTASKSLSSLVKQESSESSEELPPSKTAEACLVTAHELETQGHVREAISLYERARQASPDTVEVEHRLAVLYGRSGAKSQAKTEFAAALKLHPKDADLRSDHGYFLMQIGDFETSESELRRALEIEPSHKVATINLAMLYARLDRYDESLKLFTEAVGPAAAHSNVGVLLAKAGKREDALDHFQKATELDPDLPQATAFIKYLSEES